MKKSFLSFINSLNLFLEWLFSMIPLYLLRKKKTSAQTDYLFGNWAQKSNTFENWTQNDYIFWKLGIKILYIWKLDTKILYIWKLGTKNYTFENWAQKDYIFKKLGTKKYLFWKLVINILNMSYHKSLCNSLFRRLEVRWKSSATFITSSIAKRVTSTFFHIFHIFPHFSSLPVHIPNSCCKLHCSKEKVRLTQDTFDGHCSKN